MGADSILVEELKKHLIPGAHYKVCIFREISHAGKIFERIANEGFPSFVVQHQQTPAATIIAVEMKNRQSKIRFDHLLHELAREGLIDTGPQ